MSGARFNLCAIGAEDVERTIRRVVASFEVAMRRIEFADIVEDFLGGW